MIKKTASIKSKTWLIILTIIITIALGAVIVILIIRNNNKYAGTYNYNNRYTITLRQDGTCDFAENGESGYSGNVLKCKYEIRGETVFFDREVISLSYEKDNIAIHGKGVGPNFTCEKLRGRYPLEYCKEEIVTIQETAPIGETGMVYESKVYTKLK